MGGIQVLACCQPLGIVDVEAGLLGRLLLVRMMEYLSVLALHSRARFGGLSRYSLSS